MKEVQATEEMSGNGRVHLEQRSASADLGHAGHGSVFDEATKESTGSAVETDQHYSFLLLFGLEFVEKAHKLESQLAEVNP